MYTYMMKVKNQQNMERIVSILQPVIDCDVINDKIARENISQLEKLKEMDENELYEYTIDNLRKSPPYSKLLK